MNPTLLTIQSILTSVGVPIFVVIAAKWFDGRSSSENIQVDAQGKFLQSVIDDRDKAITRLERSDERLRKMERRNTILEWVIAQVAAEATVTAHVAEEIAEGLVETCLQTEARRLALSAAKLRQLARKPDEEDDDEPVRGIGAKD